MTNSGTLVSDIGHISSVCSFFQNFWFYFYTPGSVLMIIFFNINNDNSCLKKTPSNHIVNIAPLQLYDNSHLNINPIHVRVS